MRHRAPPSPPLLARLNQPTPLRVAVIAGGAVIGVVCSVVGIAKGVGDSLTPAASTAVQPPAPQEPTGRGGPLAPIFEDLNAPHYDPEPAPSVNTPQRQVTVTTQRPQIATSAPRNAANPPPHVPATPAPATEPQKPAEPEPVGLPVVAPAEVAPPAEPIEETPVTEQPTEPPPVAIVDEPTGIETEETAS